MQVKGINLLDQIVRTSSDEKLEQLLGSYVIVTEKLDAARITFQITPDGVQMWRKDDRIPMSIIDRTLMQYYEKAIDHITKISEVAVVPADAKFGCYYFTDSALKIGGYSRVPKNNLVLSDVRIVENGVERIYDDIKTIRKWAEELRIEPLPVIFQGRLTDKQKEKIIGISKMDVSAMKDATGGSFSKYLVNLLNPLAGSTFLRAEGVYDCDSLIFKFKTDGGKVISAKVMDYAFDARAESNHIAPEDRVPSDLYTIALMDVCSFLIDRGISQYVLKERTTDFRYLELICHIFNDFLLENSERYKGVDFSEPEFMKPYEFKMNMNFVSNEQTKALIQRDRAYEQLFKIFLAGLRKKRRRTYGLLTQRMISEINMIVDMIQEKVQPPITEGLMDFSTFRIFKDEITEPIIYDEDEKWSEVPQKEVIVIFRRQFYTIGMDEILKNAHQGCRVLCILIPEKDNIILPRDIIEGQVQSAIQCFQKGITMTIAETEEEMVSIVDDEREEFDVNEILCETDFVGWAGGIFPWATIKDIGRLESEDTCIDCITRDNYWKFKDMCPSSTTKYFVDMQSKYFDSGKGL